MKISEPSSTGFSASDLYLTAYLITCGLELLTTKSNPTRRLEFILKDAPGRAQLVQDYYSDKAQVNPLKFKNAIVNLKSLIHGLRAHKDSSEGPSWR